MSARYKLDKNLASQGYDAECVCTVKICRESCTLTDKIPDIGLVLAIVGHVTEIFITLLTLQIVEQGYHDVKSDNI